MAATAQGADLNSRTVAGRLAFCQYVVSKGYAPAPQVNNWRGAIRKVCEMVDGEQFEAVDLLASDLDEYLGRFQTLAQATGTYKAESITAYKQRVRRAVEAHDYYLETGKPPSFAPVSKRAKSVDKDKTSAKPSPVVKLEPKAAGHHVEATMEFRFPLDNGVMATFNIPPRLTPSDVNRLCAFLRTLQKDDTVQRQLPTRTGEDAQAA